MNGTFSKTPETTLTAELLHGAWCVLDSDGGIWHPGDEATEEIARADAPKAVAEHICATEPMRGSWSY